jgi:leucyl aminopeptidase
MHPLFVAHGDAAGSIPIWFAGSDTLDAVLSKLDDSARAFARASGFEAKAGRYLLLAKSGGGLAGVLFGIEAAKESARDLFLPGRLPELLPPGTYRFANAPHDTRLGALADRHGAKISVTIGDDLAKNFPLIHAVGMASVRAPRLIDITWGKESDPKITLVGKGVCFDTGGLDIKNDAGMLNMKKDMGGAACVLALAHMLMSRGLKLRLRVLIPAVENSISGAAFRPRDIYKSRKGITVEIGNTDAEGRLVLADALALADEESPELIADMATLTGAARVALGPELPPFYTGDDALAGKLTQFSVEENDPLWRMPLWQPYDQLLDSKVADMNNVSSSAFAGSITAALFLKRFVTNAKAWAHFDIFAWVPAAKSGRPEGGECQAARALYALLAARYG